MRRDPPPQPCCFYRSLDLVHDFRHCTNSCFAWPREGATRFPARPLPSGHAGRVLGRRRWPVAPRHGAVCLGAAGLSSTTMSLFGRSLDFVHCSPRSCLLRRDVWRREVLSRCSTHRVQRGRLWTFSTELPLGRRWVCSGALGPLTDGWQAVGWWSAASARALRGPFLHGTSSTWSRAAGVVGAR